MTLRRKIASFHQNQRHSLWELYLRGVNTRLNLLQRNPIEQVCHKIRHNSATYNIHLLLFQNQIRCDLCNERQNTVTKRIKLSFSLNHENITI